MSIMSSGGNILVVDDALASLKLIEHILTENGYTVFTANSGEMALSVVHSIMPNIILLDIRMGGIDGFEVCQELKRNPLTKDIPVIFLSALLNAEDKIQGLKHGAVDFISKPFHHAEMLTRVQTHIHTNQMRLQFEQQAKELMEINQQLEIEIAMRKQAEERYEAFINADTDMIFLKDDQFRYLVVNDAMAKFFGKTKDEMIGKTDQELSDKQLTFPCFTSDKKALESVLPFVVEELLGDRFCETTKFPLQLNGYKKGIGGIIRDVTNNKVISDALIRSEHKYRYLFENNPAPMWIYDLENLRFLEVNDAAIDHYGFSREEFLSMTIKDIRPEYDVEMLLDDVESKTKILNNSTVWRHLNKNGEIIYVNIISHLIEFEKKEARLVISNDITSRIKVEEAIQSERKLLRTLIDNLPVTIYVKDKECRKVVANQLDLETIGILDESKVIGKTDLELFNNEIGQRGYNDDLKVIQTGEEVINREEEFFDSNGHHRWLLTSKIPLFDQHGETIGLVGIGNDITVRKKAEQQIVKLSAAIEQSPLSIVITNTKGDIEYVNPKISQITGYTPDELIGQNPRIFKSGETQPDEYKELWRTISSGKEWYGEFHDRKKNGELFWESASISPIRNDKGEIINYIAIKEDITNQKQLMNELVQSKEKAEESDRLKSAFLANMSHEIRTPLNGILGFSELLADPDFDQLQKTEMSRLIIDNGDQLLAIINDVLDISKIEAGQIEIRKTSFSATQLISDVQKSLLSKANFSGVELRIDDKEPKREIIVNSDIVRVKQVLTNLVSNALKFTDSGYVEIGLIKSNSEIIFHVKDTGIGIPKEFHAKIFERFRHLEPNRSKIIGGNGLGLSISKSFIEMLGGKIWVESEKGKGSCFYFSLPN